MVTNVMMMMLIDMVLYYAYMHLITLAEGALAAGGWLASEPIGTWQAVSPRESRFAKTNYTASLCWNPVEIKPRLDYQVGVRRRRRRVAAHGRVRRVLLGVVLLVLVLKPVPAAPVPAPVADVR